MILTTEPQTAEMDGYEEVMMVELPEGVPEVAEVDEVRTKLPPPQQARSKLESNLQESPSSSKAQTTILEQPFSMMMVANGRAKTEVQVDEPPMSPLIASSLASCKRRFALSWSPQG